MRYRIERAKGTTVAGDNDLSFCDGWAVFGTFQAGDVQEHDKHMVGREILAAVTHLRQDAEALLNSLNPEAEVQIVTANYNNGDEPDLVTYDKEKAKARFMHLVAKLGTEIDIRYYENIDVLRATLDGIERGYFRNKPAVRLDDGAWYLNVNQHDDIAVKWYADRIE